MSGSRREESGVAVVLVEEIWLEEKWEGKDRTITKYKQGRKEVNRNIKMMGKRKKKNGNIKKNKKKKEIERNEE